MLDPTVDAHNLMPDELKRLVPSLYATQDQDDPIAHIKWFTPDSSWTWYVLEFDPDDQLCFGLVIGHERELGYFSFEEISALRGPLGLPVERDLFFKPSPISQCP